jgi:predicted DsbA family dithiol-disulfide isomerase
MSLPTVEVYSDIHCPWSYLVVHRLRRIWPDYAGRVRLAWRSLSLEYINARGTPKPTVEAEINLIASLDPSLPVTAWRRPDWQWPVTFWPALEALACAQAQGDDAAFAMSWALRRAFFVEGRSPSLRHEILAIAHEVAAASPLDADRFEADWDSGRYKADVLADSRRGWHELKVEGSPTFVLPNGRQVSSPGTGEADIDEERGIVHSFTPYPGDPFAPLRELLDAALTSNVKRET